MQYKTIRSHINYESISKLFFELTEERYLSSERIKHMVSPLVDTITRDEYEKIHLKIAVLSMIRNMIKDVSPSQLYRSIQHRDDIQAAVIQALEDLEDNLEELNDELEEES